MRTKSESKRQSIIDVAAHVFSEFGFERASMSEICARVGGSKATLYNYFSSKELLFFEVMFKATRGAFEDVHACLTNEQRPVADVLQEFAEGLLTLIYSPEILPVRRLVIAESGRSDLGRLFYERGPKLSHDRIAAYFASAMSRGELRQADVAVAASHFQGLMQAELQDRLMHCVHDALADDLVSAAVFRAVDVFMRAYGPES